jgi:hypothetical protein
VTRDLGGAPASVATSQPRLSLLMRSCRATRGLGIARPPVINERTRAIGGPLERSLRSSDERLRQLGSATVVVSIRRWIGKRCFIDHDGTPDGVAQRSHVLRHSIGTGKTTGRATSVPLRLRQFLTIYSRPLFRVCARLHSREITLAMSQREVTVPSQYLPRVSESEHPRTAVGGIISAMDKTYIDARGVCC